MNTAALPSIKICCIASREEAQRAIHYGAKAVGLVSAMPSGPGPIPEELIRDITVSLPTSVESFLLTSLTDPEAIIAQHRRCLTTTIQLCDALKNKSHAIIKKNLPSVKIVQVIHVAGELSIQQACEVAPNVDAILLDSGKPNLAIKELGGTGRVHNWSISKRICESVDVPVYLAGGLTPDNVAEAIRAVVPFGVDVCSGVRTDGKLDDSKLARFFEAVNNSYQVL